jgi:hypothetical protein
MTLVADIPARHAPPDDTERQERDRRIAVAEMWLCMLSGLAEIGVRFATFLTNLSVPKDRGPMLALPFIGDPLRAFARVQRAVCLVLMLMLRIDDEIADLKAGASLRPSAPAAKAVKTAEALGDKIRQIGHEAQAGDVERPERLERPERRERLPGNLHEWLGEDLMDAEFYRLLKGPLKNAIAAVCADFGLKPDWSLWTEDGFPPPPGGREEDWIAFFVPDAKIEPTPADAEREPARPPPRRDAHRAWDKTWRPPWPPPEPHNLYPDAPQPPATAVAPDDPVSRSRRASLLGTTIIAGAPGALARAIARGIKS